MVNCRDSVATICFPYSALVFCNVSWLIFFPTFQYKVVMVAFKGGKLAAVKARIVDEVERYLELEALPGLDTAFQSPIEDIAIHEIEAVEKAAVELLKAWDLGSKPLPNVIEMLEDQGIKIVEVEADKRFNGLSSRVQGSILSISLQIDPPVSLQTDPPISLQTDPP
jgi:hypothetical protein